MVNSFSRKGCTALSWSGGDAAAPVICMCGQDTGCEEVMHRVVLHLCDVAAGHLWLALVCGQALL